MGLSVLEKLDIYKDEYLPYFIENFGKVRISFEEFLSRRGELDPIVGKKVFKDGNWFLV